MPTTENISSPPAYLEEYKDVFYLEKVERQPEFNPKTAMHVKLLDGASVPQSFPYKPSAQEEVTLKMENDRISQVNLYWMDL
jgi:hypothetical protein